MNQNTYPDGFPRDPLAAIDFSYFLTGDEKQEWRSWVQNADPAQQEELVETLHSMWLEEQSKAVPAGFNVQQNPQPQPAPQPQNQPGFVVSNTQQNQSQQQSPQPQHTQAQPTPQPQQPRQTKPHPPQPKPQPVAQPKPQVAPQPQKKPSNEEKAKQFGDKKYSSNPLLDNQDIEEFNYQNEEKKEAVQTQRKTEAQTSQSQSSQRFLNIKKLRESATRKELEDLYQSYVKSRERTLSTHTRDAQSQAQFLDKVMGIVVNFEAVADYYEAMTEKLLEMNEKLVTQARDVQKIKNEYSNKQLSAQDEIDAIKDRIERLEGAVRDLRLSSNRKYQELKDEVSIFEADSLGYDGMAQRFDLLENKIDRLERQSGRATSASAETNTAHDRLQSKLRTPKKSRQQQDHENDTIIDMRDEI